MNWRQWIFSKLTTEASLIAVVPAVSVHAGGSITSAPLNKPFVIYRLQEEVPRLNDEDRPLATSRSGEVWVYDDPGSYDRIDDYLKLVRDKIAGQVIGVEGGIACGWQGESPELSDDEFKCITRFGSFQLTGVST